MLNGPSAISYYPLGVGAGESVFLAHAVWCGWMSAGWTKGRPIELHRFVGHKAAISGGESDPPLFSPCQEDCFVSRCLMAARLVFS